MIVIDFGSDSSPPSLLGIWDWGGGEFVAPVFPGRRICLAGTSVNPTLAGTSVNPTLAGTSAQPGIAATSVQPGIAATSTQPSVGASYPDCDD